MKKSIVALLFITVFGLSLKAQEESPKNVIKLSIVNLLFSEANFIYERAVTPSSSILFSPSLGGSTTTNGNYKVKNSSVCMGAEYRVYLKSPHSPNAPAGMYFAPGMNYTSLKQTEDDGAGYHYD